MTGLISRSQVNLYISEPEPRESGAILVCDEDHNDIAEFFHNEHATVGQSYEMALMLARKLVESSTGQQDEREAMQDQVNRIHGAISDYGDMAPEEDETWESWYHAAFDMLSQKVRKVTDKILALAAVEQAPGSGELSDAK